MRRNSAVSFVYSLVIVDLALRNTRNILLGSRNKLLDRLMGGVFCRIVASFVF